MSPRRLPDASPTLLTLPPELLHHLLSFLFPSLPSLLSLSLVCRSLHSTITHHSLPHYLRQAAYAPVTVAHSQDGEGWSTTRRACWTERVKGNWETHEAVAELLPGERGWERKCMPLLKLWPRSQGRRGRLLLARGEEIELWEVDSSGFAEQVPLRPWFSKQQRDGQQDITGISVVEGSDQEFVLGRVSGLVQRMRVEEPRWDALSGRWEPGRTVEVARYGDGAEAGKEGGRWSIQALSLSSSLLTSISTLRQAPTYYRRRPPSSSSAPTTAASLAALPPSAHAHRLSLSPLNAPWIPPTSLDLPSKPWSLLLQPTSTPSWLVIGHTGLTPLSLTQLHPSGDPTPLEPLCSPMESGKPSAVYALCSPHPLSTTLYPTQTVVAGYYDSTTRVYDLRRPTPSAAMELKDPWSDDPCYSLASGGPGGSWIACGSARGGAVRLWDVRAPRMPTELLGAESPQEGGTTLFAPTPDRSPIYSLAMESSRTWGVTERRGFGFDFAPRSRGQGVRWMAHEGEGRGTLRQAKGSGSWEREWALTKGRGMEDRVPRAMAGGRWERGVRA